MIVSIYLSHNVSNLVYHIVCPAKYRRVVFDEPIIEEKIRQICLEIEKRYNYIKFLEIGVDNDHVHFLVQSTPNYSPSQIVKTIKSITARQIFVECINGIIETAMKRIGQHIRRRIRMIAWKQWKVPKYRIKRLIGMGISEDSAKALAYSIKGYWTCSQNPTINQAIPNKLLKKMGLVFP